MTVPGAGPGNDNGDNKHLMRYLFSGAGGAVLAVVVGVLIGAGHTVVSTTTVHGPIVTQYESVSPSGPRPCSGTKVAGGPPYEPNNSIAEAYGPVKAGQQIIGSLGAPHEQSASGGDEDFFAFCISHAAAVNVQLRHTGCEHETEDFHPECGYPLKAELINNRGESVQTATVGDTTQATLAKRLPPGRYYVRIFGGEGSEYELEVSAGAVPLQPTVSAVA
jgi:hypothetical protein